MGKGGFLIEYTLAGKIDPKAYDSSNFKDPDSLGGRLNRVASYNRGVLKQAGMPDPRYLAKGLLKVDPDSKSAGGDKCPFCGSHDVSYMTGRDEGLEIRGSHAFHSLQCYNCHSEWEEHFSLKLKKMDVRKYPSKVLQSKPVDASPVGRTKIWSVGKSAASSLLDAWGIIGEDE